MIQLATSREICNLRPSYRAGTRSKTWSGTASGP